MLPVREMRNVPGSEPVSEALASVATIVTTGVGGAPRVPGEPITVTGVLLVVDRASVMEKAPLTPEALSVAIIALVTPFQFKPAALSNDLNGLVVVAAPKVTPALLAMPSKRFTWSPPVPRPTP